MKIIAAATALNIVKNEEKRYNIVKKSINEAIIRSAEFGEEEISTHIINLNINYINRLLKELKEAGYIIKKFEDYGLTKTRTMNAYVTISWAET